MENRPPGNRSQPLRVNDRPTECDGFEGHAKTSFERRAHCRAPSRRADRTPQDDDSGCLHHPRPFTNSAANPIEQGHDRLELVFDDDGTVGGGGLRDSGFAEHRCVCVVLGGSNGGEAGGIDGVVRNC